MKRLAGHDKQKGKFLRRTIEAQPDSQEAASHLDELKRRTLEAQQRFLTKQPEAGVEGMRRRVVATLGVSIRDKEDFIEDEKGGLEPETKVIVLDEYAPRVQFPPFIGRAGGEVRVEVHIEATADPSGRVWIDNTTILFEGDDENTTDEDGRVTDLDHDNAVPVDFWLPMDSTQTLDYHIVNQDEGGDEAWVVVTFANVPRD
jgi:hypothetical protein